MGPLDHNEDLAKSREAMAVTEEDSEVATVADVLTDRRDSIVNIKKVNSDRKESDRHEFDSTDHHPTATKLVPENNSRRRITKKIEKGNSVKEVKVRNNSVDTVERTVNSFEEDEVG